MRLLGPILMTGVVLLAGAAAASVTSYPAAFFAVTQPTTALDMIALVPGFTFDRGGGVRGFGGAAGNVLIDGARPASKDDSLDETLKRIPASSVLRIDVIRGGAPGVDMQGKTVLANVIHRPDGGAKLLLAASATRSADDRYSHSLRAEGSLRKGLTSYEASVLISKGFDDGEGNGPRTRRAADGTLILQSQEINHGLGTANKATAAVETPLAGGKLRISGSLSSYPYDLTTDDALSTPRGREFEHYSQPQDTAEVGLRYERPLGERLKSETFFLQQLGRSGINDAFRADPQVSAASGDDLSDVFTLRKTTGETILRSKLRLDASPKLSFEAGAEGAYNWLTARTTFLQDGTPVALPAANVHVTEARGEAFATATWSPSAQLTVETGVRLEASRIASTGDVISGNTFVFPKPRAVVTWSPDGPDQVRFRVEREVGQLNFDDFAANSGNISTGAVRAGNPSLSPQQDWVLEAAFERRFWGAGDATVTVRHFALTDVIDRVPEFDSAGNAFDAPGNIGPGRQDELAFSLTLPTDKLGVKRGLLTGSTTFRNSRVSDPTTGLPRPISDVHSNDWEAHFTQGFPALKSTWGFDVLGQWQSTSYRFNEIDTVKLKPYVALFAEYKPKRDLTFRFELKNVSGHGLEQARDVFAGPRDRAGFSYGDVRDLHTGRFVYLKVIKTFG